MNKEELLAFMMWMREVPLGGDQNTWTDEEHERIADAYLKEEMTRRGVKCFSCDRELSFTGGAAWINWSFGTKDGWARREPVCVYCFTPIMALRHMFKHLRRACL